MRILVTVLLLAPVATIPAAPMPNPTAFAEKEKGPITDDTIRDQVMMHLAGDADVKGGGINVEVKDGVVTLTGPVDTDKAQHKAERLAKKVKGVKSVVNKLTLRQ